MNGDFKNYTNKERLAKVLLSCLTWASSIDWSSNIEDKVKKRLKVPYPFDSWRLRSCIDLLEDTEYAILSFSRFGLEKFSARPSRDFGGIYLRLYGILNAVQQQKLTIIEIFETLKLSGKNKIKNQLDSLKIVEIRNVVGAHTINLNDNGDYLPNDFKRNFFRITQNKITPKATGLHAVDGFGNIREYNLYDSIIEYNRVSESILYNGVTEYLNKIFKHNDKLKSDILNHYEIDFFKPHDYYSLYENETKSRKHRAKLNKEIQKEFEKHYELSDEEIEKMFNEININTPPNSAS